MKTEFVRNGIIFIALSVLPHLTCSKDSALLNSCLSLSCSLGHYIKIYAGTSDCWETYLLTFESIL